jgi:cysteinyl-tRNA synthetase
VLDRLDEAIADDLNTPRLVAALQEALRAGDLPAGDEAVVVAAADTLLGLGLGEPERIEVEPDVEDEIRALVGRRQEARDARDWALADDLRAELEQRGVRVKDTAAGPEWEIVR